MMTMVKEGSTNSVNFMSPRAGILMLGCRNITHIVDMYYFLKNQPLNFFLAYIVDQENKRERKHYV